MNDVKFEAVICSTILAVIVSICGTMAYLKKLNTERDIEAMKSGYVQVMVKMQGCAPEILWKKSGSDAFIEENQVQSK